MLYNNNNNNNNLVLSHEWIIKYNNMS